MFKLSVYEVTNVIGLERMVNGLTLLGYVDIVCDPLCTYEGFAKRIGVSDQLTAPSPRNLESEQCLWADFTVEYTGMLVVHQSLQFSLCNCALSVVGCPAWVTGNVYD